MLQELKPNKLNSACSFFQGFDYSLSIHAAQVTSSPCAAH